MKTNVLGNVFSHTEREENKNLQPKVMQVLKNEMAVVRCAAPGNMRCCITKIYTLHSMICIVCIHMYVHKTGFQSATSLTQLSYNL